MLEQFIAVRLCQEDEIGTIGTFKRLLKQSKTEFSERNALFPTNPY